MHFDLKFERSEEIDTCDWLSTVLCFISTHKSSLLNNSFPPLFWVKSKSIRKDKLFYLLVILNSLLIIPSKISLSSKMSELRDT